MLSLVQPPAPSDNELATTPPWLTFDNPEAYIAGDRRRALSAGQDLPDRVRGAALFADISGFTPLTEALASELGPQRGAEHLSATLNQIFDRLLVELHRHGGSVIYFSGDAVTCWLDGDDALLATSCGLAMQHAMSEVGLVTLPSGRTVQLAMKVAVATGAARRFVVGDPGIQLIDVLAGALMDDLAEAEHHAKQGEVVLERAAVRSLADRVELAETRGDEMSGRYFGVVRRLPAAVTLPDPPPERPPLPEEVVRHWLLPAVYERLRTGLGEFLAELRYAIPLFIRFGGIDYDRDPRAQADLNDFVVRAQRVIDGYGGSALQLTIGDKGAYLYAVFGAPLAHEDDPARACAAALELRELERECAVTGIRIGIAAGRLRSGTYGHATRRTFCCLGDAVNLAARLMSAAPAGHIYVADSLRSAAGERYAFEQLPALRVKGKAQPVVAHALHGSHPRGGGGHRRHALRMVGRDRQLGLVENRLSRAVGGQGQVVGVSAEAGMGKSRLLAEAAERIVRGGIRGFEGEAQAFGAKITYFAWREIWMGIFGLPADATLDEQRRHLEEVVGALDPELVPRVPLLGTVLGLALADNALTSSFDAKLRKASLELLLAQHLARLASETGPVAILVEDCHWLDPLSQDLLAVIARAAEQLPVLLLLAYRPLGGPDAPSWHAQLLSMNHFTEIELDELDSEAARTMIGSLTHQLFGLRGDPPESLMRLMLERGEGNPFHIEELLTFVKNQGVDPLDDQALARLEVPESVNGLVLSRIDTLPEAPRRTLKVASVIGRLFREPMLRGTYPRLGPAEQVHDQLDALLGSDLVLLENEAEHSYLFRHVVIRDVAYDGMPFAMREMLHERVASYLERDDSAASAGSQLLDLLAHHYWHSANADKKVEYLLRAGDAAQASYANAVAIDYFRRADPLVAEAERAALLLKLGRVLELVGGWAEADETYRRALTIAGHHGDRQAGARARTAIAEVARKRGRYDEAAGSLALAEREFTEIGDEAGLGQVLQIGGTLAAQRGQYAEAREKYETSLRIRQRLGDRASVGALLSNLGVIAEYDGDYASARELNERALALRTRIGDRWAIGVSQNNLGMIALLQADLVSARDRFAESMRLNREVGDLWMVAIGHNNLGNTMRRMGDLVAAGPHYAASLRAYRGFDDRWALSILYEDIAVLAADADDLESALLLTGAADVMREELGSPRSPAQQEALDAVLSPARAALGARGDQCVVEGRALGAENTVAVALRVCLPR